jgi:hypothetical protein
MIDKKHNLDGSLMIFEIAAMQKLTKSKLDRTVDINY